MTLTLVADVASANPTAIQSALAGLLRGTVTSSASGFHIETTVEGSDPRAANRELLSALRRVERRTTLRAEWTHDGTVHRFFDYVAKGTRPAP